MNRKFILECMRTEYPELVKELTRQHFGMTVVKEEGGAAHKGVHDGRCSLLLCDTRTEMCCLDLEWRDTLCVHTAVRVAEYRASCVFCTLYVRGLPPKLARSLYCC